MNEDQIYPEHKDWHPKWNAMQDARKAKGLVVCDDEYCTAKEEPQTCEEYTIAFLHWRDHGYLAGCSHGC